MRAVYLDNNATTRPDEAVAAAMWPYLTQIYGNASSAHGFGEAAAEAVRRARAAVRALICAASDAEIVFTGSGTEANNTALKAGFAAGRERDEVIVSAVEHPAVLAPARALQAAGARVHVIGVDERGRLDRPAFTRTLTARTALVSVMWANNETGTLFPIAELAAEAHAVGALFHTDAVQAAGRTPLDVGAAGVDYLSLSAHKLHGPKGVGALYVRKGAPMTPLLLGGGQERRRRAGTQNVPGIVGFGVAADLARARLPEDAARISDLRDALEAQARALGAVPLGDIAARLPNTASLAFPGVDGEALQQRLDRAGVAVSLGSACASGSMAPSHVLTAMGLDAQTIRGALRFSLSRETDWQDIEQAIAALRDALDWLASRAAPSLETVA